MGLDIDGPSAPVNLPASNVLRVVKNSMKRIMSISDLGKTDIDIAGGKGANLGELVSAGFNVPPGFVLTTAAYDYFLETSKISENLKDILSKVDTASESSLADASGRIRELFEKKEIPEDLKEQILASYKAMFKGKKAGLVAVRSSATAEDLPTASFAGQQDTYLNVADAEDLLDKVQEVLVLPVHSEGHRLPRDQGLRALQGQAGRRGPEDDQLRHIRHHVHRRPQL